MTRKTIFRICLVVFVCAAVVLAGYEVPIIYREHKMNVVLKKAKVQAADVETETEKEAVEIPIDFKSIQEVCPDIYAWIAIPDTVVDYPIVRSAEDDTDYYLDKTITGDEGLPGSIYTQSIYNSDNFEEKVTVIYGHNMKDGTMFGSLDKYSDQEYREKHQTIQIYTAEKILTYRVAFAITYTNDSILYYYDCNNEKSDIGYQDFLKHIQENRNLGDWIEEPFTVTTDDRMIILSTCNGNSDQRYLIGAVLTDVQGE